MAEVKRRQYTVHNHTEFSPANSQLFPKRKDHFPRPSYTELHISISSPIIFFIFIIHGLSSLFFFLFCLFVCFVFLQILLKQTYICWPLSWSSQTFQDTGQKILFYPKFSRPGKMRLSYPKLSQFLKDYEPCCSFTNMILSKYWPRKLD